MARRDEIIAVVGAEPPIGGHKAAARLAERSGLAVEKPDVEALADADLLAAAGWYKEWPLWDCRALDGVDVGLLSAIVAERQAWIAGSVSKWDAPGYLGWRRSEFAGVAQQRGLALGRLDRYAAATGRSQLVAIGVAQEYQRVFTGTKDQTPTGAVWFSYTRTERRVACYYFYLWDEGFGPAFIKICAYFPYPGKIWFNGREWAKRQAARAGMPRTTASPSRPALPLRPRVGVVIMAVSFEADAALGRRRPAKARQLLAADSPSVSRFAVVTSGCSALCGRTRLRVALGR
jgi:hypothetical protein